MFSRTVSGWKAGVAVLVLAAVVGCTNGDNGDDLGGTGITTISTALVVEPSSAVLAIGQSLQLKASGGPGLINQGAGVPQLPQFWTSSAPGIVSVTPVGLVTALSAGGAVITVNGSRGKGQAVIVVK
jgi:uncharacterized protein YjdB